MPKHRDRISELVRLAPPPKESVAWQAFLRAMAMPGNEHVHETEMKQTWRTRLALMTAQLDNGTGLIADQELRQLLREYDQRIVDHSGFGKLPGTFNVIEAFLRFHPR